MGRNTLNIFFFLVEASFLKDRKFKKIYFKEICLPNQVHNMVWRSIRNIQRNNRNLLSALLPETDISLQFGGRKHGTHLLWNTVSMSLSVTIFEVLGKVNKC